MSLKEKVARRIAEFRNVDPDAAVIIVHADGAQAEFDPAWKGYEKIAKELIALVHAGP